MKKLLLAFLLLAGAASSRSRPTPTAKPGAKRRAAARGGLLLIGDSQSVGANSPGGQLAALLGAQVEAKGGRTARYWVGDGLARLLSALKLFAPKTVIVFLGSNELSNVALLPSMLKKELAAHTQLARLIRESGARVLFVGPPNFAAGLRTKDKQGKPQGAPLNDYSDALTEGLRAVYGYADFIDARPYTPAHKGIHFSNKTGAAFAAALAPAVKAKL